MYKRGLRRILFLGLLFITIISYIRVYAWEINQTNSVSRIIDGDTFEISGGDKVRLADISAPEPNESGGPQATTILTSIIEGKTVYLDTDPVLSYGRFVAVVYIKHNQTHYKNVNKLLWDSYSPPFYEDPYPNEFNPSTWTLYVQYAPINPTPDPTPPPPPPPLPPVLSDLTVTPAEIGLGTNVTISLNIMNLDSQSFTYMVTMQIGELTLLVDVELEPYELETVSRTITPDTVGDYNVTVDGMTGSFKVKPPLPAEFVISELEATLDEVGLQPWVVFDVLVKNIGETKGTYTVEFKLLEATSQPTSGDGETIDTQNVTLAPGGSHHARAFYFLPRAGTYQVSVGNLTEIFDVRARLEPAKFEFSNLVITPRVEEGMSVNISVDAANVGEEMGDCTVELKVNGEVVDSVEIPPFGGGVTATQFFELTRGEGTYEVEVEGLTGSFTVFKPEPSFWDKIPGFPYVSIIIGLIVVIIISGSRARSYSVIS